MGNNMIELAKQQTRLLEMNMKERCRLVFSVYENKSYGDFDCSSFGEFCSKILKISRRQFQFLTNIGKMAEECKKLGHDWVWELPWSTFVLICKIGDAKRICSLKEQLKDASFEEANRIFEEVRDSYK
jgi:hypothetical protein